jgi:hypothetical protein
MMEAAFPLPAPLIIKLVQRLSRLVESGFGMRSRVFTQVRRETGKE